MGMFINDKGYVCYIRSGVIMSDTHGGDGREQLHGRCHGPSEDNTLGCPSHGSAGKTGYGALLLLWRSLLQNRQTGGICRVVSDYGTTYYLCDVIVAPEWQGKRIGRAMLEKIQSDPRFCDLRGILVSRDAQDFYSRFGFEKSDRGMVKQPAIEGRP